MSNETLKQDPCENCILRKGFAKAFDAHFWGEGCPYKCDEYDDWKCRTGQMLLNPNDFCSRGERKGVE